MKPTESQGGEYDFYFPEADVHLRVENNEDEVLLRATSSNFPERRKAAFIRHLADEGFIPIHYRWFSNCSADGFSKIRWIVDISWLKIPPALTRRTNHFMKMLLFDVSLLWLAMVGLILLRNF